VKIGLKIGVEGKELFIGTRLSLGIFIEQVKVAGDLRGQDWWF
jgi:hypothetical protein